MNRSAPDPSEYTEYYGRYIQQVPAGDIVVTLRDQLASTTRLLRSVPADRVEFRYAPGKWTLREVLGHVTDMEWVFGARAIHFARAVEGALPGFEQDDAMRVATFPAWNDLIDQFAHARAGFISFAEALDAAAWNRKGVMSGNAASVRAVAYVLAGHERHHVAVIQERYLR